MGGVAEEESAMNPPGRDTFRAILESICAHSRIAVALVDDGGRIVWANRFAGEEFPGHFAEGRNFDSVLEQCTYILSPAIQPGTQRGQPSGGELRCPVRYDGHPAIYRYFKLPADDLGPRHTLRYLSNISEEKQLEQDFLHSLCQLKSMREIVDILYESLRTQEVIYLILVAVTAQMGFGFNRAFFLQVKGARLKGRIGIGPSNHEEANQIWTRLAKLNYSSLREVYNDLTHNGGVPDPRTQEIALQLDFDLSPLKARAPSTAVPEGPAPLPGLLGALQSGKPMRLHLDGSGSEVDRSLYKLLSTDVVAVVPLHVRGEVAGVILADNFITRRPIQEADLAVLKTFAGYAGVALERSHLYDELRDSIAKLQEANVSLKENQEKLLQAEKLSAIGELAAQVSHEIRNPLVAIGGLARSLLKDQIGDPDTAETLQIIASEVGRLEKFLKETLDFVKPPAAKPISVDLNSFVPECVSTFKNDISRNSIEVDLDLFREPVRCLLDPDLLRNAVSNLIRNAIEALSSRGGKISIGVRKNDGVAVVRVGDTGPGIPAEVIPRIFDPFFTTKPQGTGLGLTIASQNLRSLGGHLELENDLSFKTLFKLTLPLEPCSQRSAYHGEPEEIVSGACHENRARSR
jgi:signal transduction histidine kinase